MAKHIILFMGLLFLNKKSSSQYSDSTYYRALFAASGSLNKVNSNTAYLLNHTVLFGIKKKRISLTTTNNWIYGKQNHTQTNNDFSSTTFLNLYGKRHSNFYYWGLLNYNAIYSLKVNNQWLTGAGVAYSFIDRENIYVNISDGILYDQSNLLVNEVYNTIRNSFRLQYRFVFKKMGVIDASNFYQTSLSRKHDFIIRSNTSFGIKFKKWITLNMALNYNRMNITERENLHFTYGFLLDRYF